MWHVNEAFSTSRHKLLWCSLPLISIWLLSLKTSCISQKFCNTLFCISSWYNLIYSTNFVWSPCCLAKTFTVKLIHLFPNYWFPQTHCSITMVPEQFHDMHFPNFQIPSKTMNWGFTVACFNVSETEIDFNGWHCNSSMNWFFVGSIISQLKSSSFTWAHIHTQPHL